MCYNKLMNKRAVIGAICAISTLFAFNGSASTFADEGVGFSVDVSEAALQLTAPETATIELNPISSAAVFNSASFNVNVATNNMTGYTLTMSVATTDLTHNTLANTVIPTLSAASTEANFPANAWGYKVVGDEYQPILTTNAPASWAVEEPTNGTNHNIVFGAKVDGSKPAGAYETILNFQAVANPNAFKDTISFNGNSADGGSMTNQLIYQGEPTKLSKNTYTKTGYLFNGWNTRDDGLGTGYSDEDSFTPTVSASAKTVTLYAQWICDSSVSACSGVPSADGSGGYSGKTIQDAFEMAYVRNEDQSGNYYDTNAGRYKKGLYVPVRDNQGKILSYFEATQESDYSGIPAGDLRFAIQDIDLTIDGVKVCDYATVMGSTAYVMDLRDYTSYHIAKLADGRCWLTDNLALDPTNASTASRMTPNNTNATTEVIYNYLHGGNSGNVSGWTSTAVYNAAPYAQFDQFVAPQVDNTMIDAVSSDSMDKAGNWKVGVYYNYCAASIGTYCYSRGNYQLDREGTDIDTIYDVCPDGWRMPTSGDEADGQEWKNIKNAYYYLGSSSEPSVGSFSLYKSTLRLPYSGEHNYWGDIREFGTKGEFWSATYIYRGNDPNSEMSAATIWNTPSAGWGGYHNRSNSANVRCIAKP